MKMKCHYDVLNIARDADDNEIKQAYRKLALKWHPDKNLNNTEHAKEQFQLVQQAYEILSDHQERAWYDKHREQILHGSNSNYKDNSLDVFQYFTTTCFKGYNDDENGFYCTYAKVFEQIAKEDVEYLDDKEEMYDIPEFGNSQSDYDEVVAPFYNYWMSYSTRKSYVWLDPHDIREAPNRKIFKLIEKENDKVRQKAKKERNEEVRSLVAFVRKRDKRVQVYVKNLETKKIENREKQKKIANQKRLERIKQLNESSEQAEWMKFDNVRTELEEVERKLAEQFGDELNDTNENSDLEDENSLYCVACNKIFKTPKAFKNHETSKKHKENVESIKDMMITEDLIDNSTDDEINKQFDENNLSTDETETNLLEAKSKKKNKKLKKVFKIVNEDSDIEIIDRTFENTKEDVDNDLKSSMKQKRKKRKEKVAKKENDNSNENKECAIESSHSSVQIEKLDNDKCCVKCKAQFPSKNKLFEHLKNTGHSTYINSSSLEKNRRKGVKQK